MNQAASEHSGATSTPQPAATLSRQALWLERLRQAAQPLTQSALFGRSATPSDRALLAELLASGDIVNLASKPKFALVAREDAVARLAPLQLARKAVLNALGLSLTPLSLATSTLAKAVGAPVYLRTCLRQAVANLVDEGLVLPLKVNRANFVIGVAGIRHHLAQVAAPESSQTEVLLNPAAQVSVAASGLGSTGEAASQQAITPESLKAAYALTLPLGGSMVEIGALQRQLGCTLATLHAELLKLLQQEQLYLVQGEPQALSADDLAAGLTIDGVIYYCVELC